MKVDPILVRNYKLFSLDETASLDDIKTRYRLLAKSLHPDVNKAVDAANNFMILQETYDYLMKHHVQKVVFKGIKIYRILSSRKLDCYNVTVPRGSCELDDVMLYCMIDTNEIRFNLKKGTKFPLDIETTNLKRKMRFHITEYDSW